LVRRGWNALASFVLPAVLPGNCLLCRVDLDHSQVSRYRRVPVCDRCLAAVEPMQADYHCAACRTPFLNQRPLDESGLCYLCRHQVNRFDASYAYASYEAEMREIILMFKYRRIDSLAAPLGRMLAQALPRQERFDAVVPVPLH
jgi:predicted amidophosphoribosyltransferase